MYRISRPKGAALISVLAIVVLVSALVLIGVRALLTSSRTTSRNRSFDRAVLAAQAGIAEGRLRYRSHRLGAAAGNTVGTSAQRGLYIGEYGFGAKENGDPNSASAYSLTALRRGFTNEACTALGSDVSPVSASGYNRECPYFDLIVRRRKVVDFSPGGQVNRSTLSYPYSVFPDSVNPNPFLELNIPRYTPFVATGVTTGGGLFQIEVCNQYSDVAGATCSTPVTMSNGFGVDTSALGFAETPRLLRVQYTGTAAEFTSFTISAGVVAQPLVIDTGTTIIESTGHASGVEKRYQLTIPTANSTDSRYPVLSETIQPYDSQGWPL